MNETRCYVCGHRDFDEREMEYVNGSSVHGCKRASNL